LEKRGRCVKRPAQQFLDLLYKKIILRPLERQSDKEHSDSIISCRTFSDGAAYCPKRELPIVFI
jgi:hypothetical protein